MQIDVLSSSSRGNAYLISDGETTLLLDAGIAYRELQEKSGFKVNEAAACLISHEHSDHSKAAKDLLNAAMDIYAPAQTLTALGIAGHHRAHAAEPEKVIAVKTFKIMPISLFHDCACYGYMVYSEKTRERLFFATDTYKIVVNPSKVDYLIVEINYQKEVVNSLVNEGIIEQGIRARLLYSHFEYSNAVAWLRRIDKSRLKRIYVAHLSNQNCNADEVKRGVIAATGIPTTICEA